MLKSQAMSKYKNNCLLIGCPSRKWKLWRTSPCLARRLSSQYLMMLWRSWRKDVIEQPRSLWEQGKNQQQDIYQSCLNMFGDHSHNWYEPGRWKSTARSLCSRIYYPLHRKTYVFHLRIVVWPLCASPSALHHAASWGRQEGRRTQSFIWQSCFRRYLPGPISDCSVLSTPPMVIVKPTNRAQTDLEPGHYLWMWCLRMMW